MPRQVIHWLKRPLVLSLALAMGVALWMLSGALTEQAPDQAESPSNSTLGGTGPDDTGLDDTGLGDSKPAEDAAGPMQVLVIDSQAQPIAREVVVQGQLEPWRQVVLRAETEGRVVALPVAKGAWVEAESLLVKLAEDDRPAQLARAQAEVAARELELSASETLGQQGMQARTQIKNAQAALASARAELARWRLDNERLEIRAPFAGVLESRDLELGSLLQRGDTVLELVDTSRLKATAQVPQQQAGSLALDQPVRVEMLDGREAQGRLIYISRVADPQTRSFRVEAEVPNPGRRLAGGLSAELRIRTGSMRGHFLSPAALTLNDQGEIGVARVDSEDVVHFVSVTLLRTGLDGVWVSGLPEQARIITRGQGFVSEGERVAPVSDDSRS